LLSFSHEQKEGQHLKYTVEKIEDAIKSGQYRDTGNIGAQDEKENKKN
jgi:hypothetical protein